MLAILAHAYVTELVKTFWRADHCAKHYIKTNTIRVLVWIFFSGVGGSHVPKKNSSIVRHIAKLYYLKNKSEHAKFYDINS